MRRHLALFAAIAAVATVLAGLSVAVVALLAAQADAGVRAGLAERAGGDLGFRVALPLAADAAGQDEQVRRAVERSFAPTGVAIVVTRQVDVRVDLRLPGQDERLERPALALGDDALPEHGVLESGAYADGPDEVAVQARAAELLGLAVGDPVVLGGRELVVSGTWTVRDPLDPRWYGDTLVVDGERELVGPFAVDESVLRELDGSPRARWVLAPDVDELGAAQLRPVVDAWRTIGGDWRGTVDDIGELDRQSRFVETAAALGAQVDGLRAAQPAVLLLLAVVGAVALIELARRLTAARSWETRLRWSRGAAPAALVTAAALEVGGVAVGGAAAGSLVGGAVATALAGGAGDASAGSTTLLSTMVATALAATAAIVAVATASAALVEAGGIRRIAPDPRRRGPARRAAVPGALVVLGAAAALSVWQLRLYGSPVTVDADGLTGVDPVAVPAPALALVAIVLLGLVALAPVAGLVARRRAGPLGVRLVVLAIARRIAPVGTAFAVVALAVGAIVLAGGYGATWATAFERSSLVRAGADLQVITSAPGLRTTALAGLAAAPSVADVAPVHVEPVQLGSDEAVLVGIDPGALTELTRVPRAAFDAAAASDAIALDRTVAALPDDATDVAVTARLTGFVRPPELAFWVADEHGVLSRVPAVGEPSTDALPGTTAVRYAAALPDGVGRTLAAVDVAIPDFGLAADTGATVGATAGLRLLPIEATVGGDRVVVDDDVFWLVDSADYRFLPAYTDGSGRGMVVDRDTRAARMTPSLGDGSRDLTDAGVVVSRTLAAQLDLAVGDPLSFALDSGIDRLTATVGAIVPAIPGVATDDAVLVDLGLVQHYQLRVRETPPAPYAAWVATDDAAAAMREARVVLPANARFERSDDPAARQVLGAGALALWLGAAGCLLLALAGVAASAGAELRARRGELGVLRALGVTSARQAAIRVGELGAVVAAGVLTGMLAGAVATALTVPQLVSAAVPARPAAVAIELAVDWAAAAAALAILFGGAVAVLAGSAARIRSAARSALPEAES